MKKPIMITITGPGASGKSTLCSHLSKNEPDIFQTVGIDNYWRDHSHMDQTALRSHNLDEPNAYDIALLSEHIEGFMNNISFNPPEICFDKRKVTTSSKLISPNKILLLEGTMAGAISACVEHASLFTFIDAPLDICLCRRLLRRRSTKHDTIAPTLEKYLEHIRPGYMQYIEQCKHKADVVLSGTDITSDKALLLKYIKEISCPV